VTAPEPADPEIAAATFQRHLAQFFATGRGATPGWGRTDLNPLEAVIRVPAIRADGTEDHYYVKLGAEYYDVWPPRAKFIEPVKGGGWGSPALSSRWWPKQEGSPGFAFGLHHTYTYPDQTVDQLLCFSHTFEYYISSHNPKDEEKWQQGVHTVSATLNRIAMVLTAPNYLGPSNDLNT
jgi:hypothetical protein